MLGPTNFVKDTNFGKSEQETKLCIYFIYNKIALPPPHPSHTPQVPNCSLAFETKEPYLRLYSLIYSLERWAKICFVTLNFKILKLGNFLRVCVDLYPRRAKQTRDKKTRVACRGSVILANECSKLLLGKIRAGRNL